MDFGSQQRAIQREAQLSGEQIARGATDLGKANHALVGVYTQAFFALSIGIERLGKLIIIADYAIRNSGSFPTDSSLRSIGHDIATLLPLCEDVGARVDSARSFNLVPRDPIHKGIISTLSRFATVLRYYNLSYLAGSAHDQDDPIALWWAQVAQPICERHYRASKRKADLRRGQLLEVLFGSHTAVSHTTEDGAPIRDLTSLVTQGGMTRVVQRYGRFYTLQIVRWLASIVSSLAHIGAYEKRIVALRGLEEPFARFLQEDERLLCTRRWSIY